MHILIGIGVLVGLVYFVLGERAAQLVAAAFLGLIALAAIGAGAVVFIEAARP